MIQDIVTSINNTLQDCLGIEESYFYNIARVINVNNDIYPVTAANGRSFKICPNDKENLKIYHKITSFGFEENRDFSFGRSKTYTVNSSAKMIVIMKSALSDVKPAYVPENFGHLIPQKIVLEDYKSITTQIQSVSTDHDFIVNREWKRNDYDKHKCKFQVFEVNYNIRALTCKLSCISFLLLEDDYKLLQESGSAILL